LETLVPKLVNYFFPTFPNNPTDKSEESENPKYGLAGSKLLYEIEYLLKLHGSTTAELKSEYFAKRYERQINAPTDHGVVTVILQFVRKNGELHIDVLSARNLKPYDSDGINQSKLLL